MKTSVQMFSKPGDVALEVLLGTDSIAKMCLLLDKRRRFERWEKDSGCMETSACRDFGSLCLSVAKQIVSHGTLQGTDGNFTCVPEWREVKC